MTGFNVSICVCLLLWLSVGISGVTTDETFQEQLLARIQVLENTCQEQTQNMKEMELRFEEQQTQNMKKMELRFEEQQTQNMKKMELRFEEQQTQNMKKMELRIEEQHTQNMKKMELRFEEQTERLAKQQLTINDHQERIKELERTVEELQTENKPQFSGDTKTTQKNHEDVKQRRVLLGAAGPVAFHAVIAKVGTEAHIGERQTIVFPDVNINLGGGYHNNHGIFIAPTPGVYIFSTSIMDSADETRLFVNLMKNGNVLANAFAFGHSYNGDQGSVTVATQLAVGDEVWVSLYGPPDASLWGDRYDSFMGCLVYPM